jgi:hypothetical protein
VVRRCPEGAQNRGTPPSESPLRISNLSILGDSDQTGLNLIKLGQIRSLTPKIPHFGPIWGHISPYFEYFGTLLWTPYPWSCPLKLIRGGPEIPGMLHFRVSIWSHFGQFGYLPHFGQIGMDLRYSLDPLNVVLLRSWIHVIQRGSGPVQKGVHI